MNSASNLDKWAAFLTQAEIPVLGSTVRELARLRRDEDNITARDISGAILRDPMLALRVLRYLQESRNNSQATEITTIEHAVMMLGVTPFFRHFDDMQVVEEVLADRPHALEGFMAVIDRGHHAALYAREWAALRHDTGADEIVVAALLHDVAEMLLWCLAPECAMQISEKMRQDRSLRSAAAQESVLGCRLIDLQLALAEKWRLPALLQSLMDDDYSHPPRARAVALAVALARHSANGWNDAALADDYAAIQKFTALSRREVMERVRRVVLRAIRDVDWTGALQPAAWLPPPSAEWSDAGDDADRQDAVPRVQTLQRVTALLAARVPSNPDDLEAIALVLHGLYAGIGLNRVLFMELNRERSRLTAKYVAGAVEASLLRKMQIDLGYPGAFPWLIENMAGVWDSAATRSELRPQLPEGIRRMIGENDFFAMPIMVKGDPVGLFYADGGRNLPVLDPGRYAEFQRLCLLFATSLEHEPAVSSSG